MTRHEELEERYADAYFSLLMEEVAIEEGRRLERENEALRQDPAAAVPEALDRRCYQTIERCFAARRRQKALRTCKSTVCRAAVLAAAVGVLFTTAFAFSETFRMMILKFDTHTRLRLEGPGTVDGAAAYDIEIQWLPDGYVFTEQSRDTQGVRYKYTAAEGRLIEISVYTDPDITVSLDSEDAEVTPLEIQGNSALIMEKGGDVQIAWVDAKTGVLWEIFGEKTPRSDVIRAAENAVLTRCHVRGAVPPAISG